MIIIDSMNLHFSAKAKKVILTIVIVFLTVLCCGNIEVPSSEGAASAGIIKGVYKLKPSNTVISCGGASVKLDLDRGGRSSQHFEKTKSEYEFLHRLFKKSIQVLIIAGTDTSIGLYRNLFFLLCITSYAYFLLLTQIRFIHLKDGSK